LILFGCGLRLDGSGPRILFGGRFGYEGTAAEGWPAAEHFDWAFVLVALPVGRREVARAGGDETLQVFPREFKWFADFSAA
jgi:hypothetical protein